MLILGVLVFPDGALLIDCSEMCVCVCVVVSFLPHWLDLSFSLRFSRVQYRAVSNKQQLVTKVILTSLSPAEFLLPSALWD